MARDPFFRARGRRALRRRGRATRGARHRSPAAVGRRVLRHWQSERTTVRQGFSALTICVSVTLVAGVVLGAMEGLLEEQPGLLILVPSAIGMRGAIFGALAARLGTGILTGQYDRRTERGSFIRQNLEAASLLTVFTAGLSAIAAWGAAHLFGQPVIRLPDLALVSMVGAVASTAVVLPATLLLARTAHSRSWDMDAIGTPIIAALADITALPALVLGVAALVHPVSDAILGVGALLLGVAALVTGLRTHYDLLRRIVLESTPVLVYAAMLQVLAGTVLSTRLDAFVRDPALLIAIPPFLAAGGAIGGILSARLSSSLHLGLIEPRKLPRSRSLLEGSLTGLFGATGYTTVGVLTLLAAALTGFASPGPGKLVGTVVVAGAFATMLLFVVAYYAATASYRFGLDPDNYGFPIVSASMDFLGIVCLVVATLLIGVG